MMDETEIKIVYPVATRADRVHRLFSKIVFGLFVLAFVACGIVNICIGGKPWSLFVLGGEIIFWLLFLYRPLIENTFSGRITAVVLSVCGYLILLDTFVGTGWAEFVVPIICFSLLILLSVIYYSGYKKKTGNPMPLYWVMTGGLVAIICALSGLTQINWPTIVLGSIAFGMLFMWFVVFRKRIVYELKKRFHN